MEHREEVCSRRLQLAALPGKYKVTGFMDGYSDYYNEVTKHETFFGNAGNWILLLGALTLVGGICSVFFGEPTTYANPGKLTSFQLMFSYPGFFAPIGILVMCIGQWISVQLTGSCMGPESYLLYNWRLILPDGTERDEKLAVRWLDGEFFEIGLKPEAG
ncbi:hypothetical protein NJC38_24150 [Pseudomonas sp. 21LCFQ010]|uniref:hypothetical protein n=1 Tax=Pseudomonas sp. 21LCFQ010 TaxID=2957506 RepID=UPI002097E70B|nr:hypothetical protein [Pseudomonas sp. 21LCFQ010]MCO8165235.1 hypothetical protein [Pseudomonas sp. 21LCFQ010]